MHTDDDAARDCVTHLHAAAAWCDAAGMVSEWATLLGVADTIRKRLDQPAAPR